MDQVPDARRKRLMFRSQRRGMQETDLVLGRFAERYLAEFTDEQLDRFERLLEAADADLFEWITGRTPVPEEHDNDVMTLLRNFKYRFETS